jgi:enoyl-[acyl-carrier protein] reductase I
MSETRPPMTAGPMARAFRFLKSTSVSCGAAAEGGGVAAGDNSGVVLCVGAAGKAMFSGEALGKAFDSAWRNGSSWAGKRPATNIASNEAQKKRSGAVIAAYSNECPAVCDARNARIVTKSMTPQVLAGKTGVVFGVANKRSIAWAIAKAWAAAGARLIFNYQGERLKENVEELVGEFGEQTPLFPCDVSSDDEIKSFFEKVRGQSEHVDLMLHSLAFAPKEALEGDFLSTTREAFRTAHDISAYSLVALARDVAPLMTNGGSIVAMTYYGSKKVVPHYNVMGVAKASLEASTRYLAYDLGPKKIRVNCISAGPVNTLAARGISGFISMLKHYQERAPLKRSCDPAELGETGVFLASDGAAAITGQVIYVDGGYQIMGM